jgi:DNA modification methylase
MREMDACSVDSVVSDPPYGLSFMGKGWDHGIPGVPFWTEALRVLKPGAHLLAFGGTRTFHRLTCAIEDAGFEIRDCVMWVYGSGFPKSLDVSKAIDKAAGHWRGKAGTVESVNSAMSGPNYERTDKGEPITATATAWNGWGTALKPAWEPIIVARKPLRGTVAANVQQYGTGALNIDGCRIGVGLDEPNVRTTPSVANGGMFGNGGHNGTLQQGRWPANVIHDGSDEVVALFPDARSSGEYVRGEMGPSDGPAAFDIRRPAGPAGFADTGSAARFFYTAKASKADRDDGLHHRAGAGRTLGFKRCASCGRQKVNVPGSACVCSNPEWVEVACHAPRANNHPTVKPVDLMRYLCRLVTPPGGTVLDPFCGSGSTGKAALLEGFDFIGIELDAEYAALARDRIYAAAPLFAEAG